MMVSKTEPDSMPPSGDLMHLLKDETWRKEAFEAEDLVEGHVFAGPGQVGWMKSWPQVQSYSQYEQLRSLVLRGFAAVVGECNLGIGQEAALNCGKPLVMERLKQPPADVQEQLLQLIEGEPLGPRVELTPERLTALKALFQQTLSSDDWEAIAQAAANKVQQQVIALMVA